MKNEIAYKKLQKHADFMITVTMDYIPPNYTKPSQWLNLDRIISDVKTLQFDDFNNAAMLFDVFNLLIWEVALGMISREKLTEFIDALSENPSFEFIVTFIIAAHELP